MDEKLLSVFEVFGKAGGQDQRLTSLSMGLTLFTPIPFRESAVLYRRLLEQYLRIVPKDIFKWQNLGGTAAQYKPLTKSAFTTIDSWLSLKKSYGAGCAIWLKDGSAITDTGEHLLRLWGRDIKEKEDDSNFLALRFPVHGSSLAEPIALRDAIYGLLQDLPFYSGYFGYTLNVSTLLRVSGYKQKINERAYAAARRFLGLEITDPVFENETMAACLRPPSWVTFLGAELIAKLGGKDYFQKQLTGDFLIHPLGHGLAIQAGSLPLLADRNREEDVSPEQRLLARILSPLYPKEPRRLFSEVPYEETKWYFQRLL
jgi:Protein of unknown function (DUF3396)